MRTRKHQELPDGSSGNVLFGNSLSSRSAGIGDLDGRGDLDIVTNHFNSRPQMLMSDLASRCRIHWVATKRLGTASNRDSLGATVRVRTASQSALPLYFGLGAEGEVKAIEVSRPPGMKQALTSSSEGSRLVHLKEAK
jgi:hypothetical protein